MNYYVVNSIVQQLLLYLVPWLVVVILIIFAVMRSKRQSVKILAQQNKIAADITDIKRILEDRKI